MKRLQVSTDSLGKNIQRLGKNLSARKRIVESEVNLASDSPLAKIKVREPPTPSSLLKRCLAVTRCSFHGSVYRSDCGANLILGLREGE